MVSKKHGGEARITMWCPLNRDKGWRRNSQGEETTRRQKRRVRKGSDLAPITGTTALNKGIFSCMEGGQSFSVKEG